MTVLAVWMFAYIWAYLQHVDSMVKVVVFHGGSGVHGSHDGRAVHQVLVSVAAVVNVMTQTWHIQRQCLQGVSDGDGERMLTHTTQCTGDPDTALVTLTEGS